MSPKQPQSTSIAWSPDGSRIAVGGRNNVMIIDADTGRPELTMTPPGSEVFGMAWSPDGSLLASSSYGGDVSLWDAAIGKLRRTISSSAPVNTLAFSPDGKLLAGGSRSQRIELWNVITGDRVACIRGHVGRIFEVCWSPDGSRLASASGDGTIKIWDPRQFSDADPVSQIDAAQGVAWSPNDDRLACVGPDGIVKLLDPETRKTLAVSSGPPIDYLADHQAWSPDGRFLISHAESFAIVWDTAGGMREHLRIPMKGKRGGASALQPDSDQLAIGDVFVSQVQLWSLSRKAKVASFEAADPSGLFVTAWSPDGQQIATGGWAGVVNIWDSASHKLLRTLRGHTPGRWIGALEWSNDGRRIASAGFDPDIIVWDAATGVRLATLRGHAAAVVNIRWSRDGERLASASRDGTVRLWDPASGDEILVLTQNLGHAEVAWSHDGTRLATTGDKGPLRIWDARIGYQRAKESAAKRLPESQ